MPATRTGYLVPSGDAVDLAAKATALEGEANITSADAELYTKVARILVVASESSGSANDADTVLSDALTAVGGLMQQPGTSYTDT